MDSESLSTELARDELLRGVPLSQILAGCGGLLAAPEVGSQYQNPAEANRLFGLSATIPAGERLDYFLSHSWRDSRVFKYLSVLLLANVTESARPHSFFQVVL